MVEVVTKIKCKYYGSEGVVKYGTYKGVRRYFCKACKRKFKGDNALFQMFIFFRLTQIS
jgi:transposase-like protein